MLERLYRLLIRLYPPAFRRRYGAQMQDDFEEMREGGAGVRVAFIDLLRSVPSEWLVALARDRAGPVSGRSGAFDGLIDLVRALARALRSLARRPGYSAVVVTSLGIGVGTATAVFSWTEGLVLRPLPAVDGLSELVTVNVRDDDRPTEDPAGSFPDFAALREALAGSMDLAAFGFGQFTVGSAAETDVRRTDRVWGAWVTADYFSILGIKPLVGRLLRPSDGGSAASERAAFISEGFWTRAFGRDPSVVGRALHVAGGELEVLGVVPGVFRGTTVGLTLDIWIPVEAAPLLRETPDLLQDRSRRWLRMFGRLAPGVERQAADREVRAVWAGWKADEIVDGRLGARVVPFDVGIAARLERLLAILLGLTGFVLLAVCTNVANLTLVRGAARDHEVAVMRALGADRRRVAGSVLAESLALGLLGITAGLVMARFGVRLLPALLPPTPLPLDLEAPMDGRVFAFCATLGLAAALLSGAAPALRAMRTEPVDVLGSRGHRTRGSSLQHASLIVVQLALSFGTLVAAGFFMDRLAQLDQVDRGFADPRHVALFPAELSGADAARAWEAGALEGLVQDVSGLQGVRSAALASFVPLGFVGYSELDVSVPGDEAAIRSEPAAYLVNRVGAGYFDLMGTRIVAGRAIEARDVPGAPTAVVVNEAFVRQHWRELDPLGRGVSVGDREAVVVGVAADGKYRFDQLDEPAPPFLFVALAQWPSTAVTLHVRVDGSTPLDAAAVRRAFESSFPLARVKGPMSLEQYTSVPLVPVRLGASVLGGLGALAMALAALGLYAIMAFRVTQRTREVGVRLAVGAGRGGILRMFVKQGTLTAVVGIAAGFPLVVGIHRLFAALVPGFDPGWVAVYSAASMSMLVVALVAVTLAARKATSIAPTEALRAE